MGYAEGISWVHHHWFAIILTCWLLQHPLSFSCSVDINGTYKKMTGVRLEKSVAPGRGWGWLWTIALLSVQSSPGQEEKKDLMWQVWLGRNLTLIRHELTASTARGQNGAGLRERNFYQQEGSWKYMKIQIPFIFWNDARAVHLQQKVEQGCNSDLRN